MAHQALLHPSFKVVKVRPPPALLHPCFKVVKVVLFPVFELTDALLLYMLLAIGLLGKSSFEKMKLPSYRIYVKEWGRPLLSLQLGYILVNMFRRFLTVRPLML